MTSVLIDHDIEGHASLLWLTAVSEGWSELAELSFLTFAEVGLAVTSSDRIVWRFAQRRGMLLLTNNRNATGEDSLERTISENSDAASLPVLTVGSVDRMVEREYRERCAERLAEVALYLDNFRGTGRVFIP